jgi:flagellar basal-body rod protein FlgG
MKPYKRIAPSPGVTRRNILQAGSLGLLGLSMTDVWRTRCLAADAGATLAKPKAVIYLFLTGGPSQQTQIPSGLQIGTGVRPIASERIFTQGNLQQTGNALDVAIQGAGFLPILMPDGTTAYTRDGSLRTDANGQLVTSSGFALQPAITIPANSQSVTIGRDGVVSVVRPGSVSATQVGTLQLANFVNPGGLLSLGENLYGETTASGTASLNQPGTNGLGLVNAGYVETSNVNVVEELVNMIQTQRAYEINSKAIQTSDQMLQKLSQL